MINEQQARSENQENELDSTVLVVLTVLALLIILVVLIVCAVVAFRCQHFSSFVLIRDFSKPWFVTGVAIWRGR